MKLDVHEFGFRLPEWLVLVQGTKQKKKYPKFSYLMMTLLYKVQPAMVMAEPRNHEIGLQIFFLKSFF
jgi:hypothetical protein